MQQIEITIDETGSTKVEAVGCVGNTCQKMTDAFEKALGRTASDQKKPEFFRQVQQGQQEARQ